MKSLLTKSKWYIIRLQILYVCTEEAAVITLPASQLKKIQVYACGKVDI